MAILGRGDLSPRRSQRHPFRVLVALLVVAVLAGGGYVGYRHFHHSSTKHSAAHNPCLTRPAKPAIPGTRGVQLTVRNATLKAGLAARVAKLLRHRDFRVTDVGNTLTMGSGVATVRYSPDQVTHAEVVAAQIAGATMTSVAGHGRLELDIGPRFHQLVSTKAARATLAGAETTSSSPTPRPTCAS